jgi:DNA polymerase III epsilon subunit-like protein
MSASRLYISLLALVPSDYIYTHVYACYVSLCKDNHPESSVSVLALAAAWERRSIEEVHSALACLPLRTLCL